VSDDAARTADGRLFHAREAAMLCYGSVSLRPSFVTLSVRLIPVGFVLK